MEEAAKLVDLAMDGYETSEKNDRDAKSALQEYLQALGEETPTYEIIGQDGPPHARVFTARVLRAQRAGHGRGRAQAARRGGRRADGAAKAEQGTMTPACGLTERSRTGAAKETGNIRL